MPSAPFFLGLDLGTSGARAVAVAASGDVLAGAATPLRLQQQDQPKGWHEQDPTAWWKAAAATLTTLVGQLQAQGTPVARAAGLAVDATSGTLVCLDRANRPLRPALMYNDSRAGEEAADLNRLAADHCNKLGYQFDASFAAAKLLWLQRHQPATFAAAHRFVHQADYIARQLTAADCPTDYSNALKSGYDLVDECWPDWFGTLDGWRQRLPAVVAPGTRIGQLSARCAAQLGLPPGLPIVSGATDGTAGFLASGARRVGDDNTTLGTTLVCKRLADALRPDPSGLLYAHKLPGGFWLPGAASNSGGEWIGLYYPAQDPAALDRRAQSHLPAPHLAYPLARPGERFPFKAPGATGFCQPPIDPAPLHYAAHLQGTAFIERLAGEVLQRASGRAGGAIYATGAASRSDIWLQLRADVNGRPVHRPACPESAFGSAVLAAAATHFGDVWTAIDHLVYRDCTFDPDPGKYEQYSDLYAAFKDLLAERGYC